MKRYGFLAGFAAAILAFAAIWLGGLNQDEGWYLYAAQLVGEGKSLYRDFFYTQGPLMPILYAPLAAVWRDGGLLGARLLTCGLGLAGIVFAAATARLLAPEGRRGEAGVIAFLLLGCNLYHLYYTSIPKTYALAALFVSMGYFLLCCGLTAGGKTFRRLLVFGAGLSLAFAAGTRISLGALLAVCGFGLLVLHFRGTSGRPVVGPCPDTAGGRWAFAWFGLGGVLGLAAVYGPFLVDPAARAGLCAAQAYHAARGGFDPVFTVGSASRLVRWYLPVFVLLGLGFLCRSSAGTSAVATGRFFRVLLGVGFLAVFAVQMLAPFPYEDYQVPVMGLLATLAAVLVADFRLSSRAAADDAAPSARPNVFPVLLALGATWACSFGSPLLQEWMTNGQDRFWSRKKATCELAQLQEMARAVESLDPGGTELLTQDLYLAIETGRKVPEGLEMGPFSMLSDEQWTKLLASAPCPLAAMSGYSFAVRPPRCDERPQADQIRYWDLLKKNYELVFAEPDFGQNATTLLILKRKPAGAYGKEKK